MLPLLELTFWLLLGSAVYSILLYPILVLALSAAVRVRFNRQPYYPKISLIISALNEEQIIAEKLKNSLGLDYPKEKLEIIVASDGSTDRTDEIVRQYSGRGVRLLRFEGGLGKTAVLNETVKHATGEILVFSDATGMYSRDSIEALASHFADSRVGCVSGRVGYRFDGGLASKGFNVYQRYALALRRAEGAFGAGFNAAGSIHAVRRSAFRPGPPDTFMDMVDPLHVAMQGLRTTLEERAFSMEEVRVRTTDEFKARLRIGVRAWSFLGYALPRMPILNSPMYCFQLMSHKFLRWMIAPSLVPIFVLNLLLVRHGLIYQIFFLGQFLYYLVTLTTLALAKVGITVRGFSALVFFNSTQLAYLIALFRYLRGKRVRQWLPER